MPQRDPTLVPVPVACTLAAGDRRRREDDWQAVTARALHARTAIPGGVRLHLRPDHDTTHALLDLVAAERDCCGWASWTLISTAAATVVEVTVTDGGDGDEEAVTMVRQLFQVS
jgi:hypothetical protein